MDTYEKKQGLLIILWSFGIALGVFTLAWLRIGSLNPYLNDRTDAMLFFLPHFFIAIWGIVSGVFVRDSITKSYSIPVRNPFICVLLTAIIFDVMFSFWAAYVDRHLNINPSTPYVFLALRATLLFSWVAILWIPVSFFVGYILATMSSFFRNKFFAKV